MSAGVPITVLVVDDHFVVRSGLAASLGLEPDLVVVAQAEGAAAALDLYRTHRPAVVLTDLRLGDGDDGVALTRKLIAEYSDARVLVFSTYGRDEEVFQAMKAGAKGYLLKTATRGELLAAVRAVAAGGRYLPPDLAGRLAGRLARPEVSPRELEVLHLVRRGKSNKQIGAELFVSEDTVKRHVTHLFQKLNVQDRAEAVAEAIRLGLLPGE
jgi:DNA-binding NarL/FixJ family response regulator